MRIRTDFRLKSSVAALALGGALALAGCGRANEATVEQTAATTPALPDLPATLPLATGAATNTTYAPAPDALPDVAPIRTVRVADQGRNYAYADSAYDFADALGDAPPDYAFDHDGVDPWAWQGYDDSTVFAEPLDGGYRYYYYRSGADQPYFVRDPDYGYGYDGGNLAVVYANDGGIVPWADYGPRVVYASRYLSRGRDLWRASRARRAPVIAANWNARRPAILQSRRAWAEARVQQPGWASYRTRYNPAAGDYWRPEAQRREADSRRYAAWQARDYRSAPPPRAIPANWQRASWARDERRYAPVREERRSVVAARPDTRGDGFEAQRRQAIAAREQALAARQQRGEERPRDARQEQRATQQAQRERAQEQRQAQLAARQQRDDRGVDREALRAQRGQARAAPQAQRGQAGLPVADRQQARAAQQAQRAEADRGRLAQAAARQEREQTQATRQEQRAEPARNRTAQAAERQQRAQARAAQQTQAAARQSRSAERSGEQAQREQATQARQQRVAERAPREQARQASAADRAQAQQARQAQQAQAAERAQAQQARQAQAAGRAQAQQARQAQQAERGQRDQAQAAERAQAAQARAARQQEQAARQQPRAERGPRGGERER